MRAGRAVRPADVFEDRPRSIALVPDKREDYGDAAYRAIRDVSDWLNVPAGSYCEILELEGPRIFERAKEQTGGTDRDETTS